MRAEGGRQGRRHCSLCGHIQCGGEYDAVRKASSTLPAAHVVSTDIPSVQIIDSIPNDTKGRVLVFLHLAR